MSHYKIGHLAAVMLAVVFSISACDSGSNLPADSTIDADTKAVDALASEERGTNTENVPAVEPMLPVVSETLPYAEVDEQLVYGYFAFPADMVEPLPGVIVIHERWGLDDGVRSLADRIAGQGFIVLAVDLYGGKTAPDTTAARGLMVEVVENPELANENIRQAYQFLIESAESPRIGSLGWSFGGGWALNAAMLFPEELDAVVIYYGQVTDNEERLAPLEVPILGLFGANDRGVSTDSVETFETALEKLGKTYEIEIYPNVGHAFADPDASNYDAEVADLAWNRVTDFLDRHLVVEK